jgi:hypothetical protein
MSSLLILTQCATCSDMNANSSCSRCHQVRYCNVQCQRKDWKRHRLFCNMSPIKTALDETSNPLTQFHTTRPEVFKKMMTLIKEDPANIYLVLLNGDITAVTNKEVLERAGLADVSDAKRRTDSDCTRRHKSRVLHGSGSFWNRIFC